jgi:hypothetical protein
MSTVAKSVKSIFEKKNAKVKYNKSPRARTLDKRID